MDKLKARSIKCLILGDAEIGKTVTARRYITGKFYPYWDSVLFYNESKNLIIDGEKLVLTIWKTVGDEDYDRLRPLSYPETDVILIAFSLPYDDKCEKNSSYLSHDEKCDKNTSFENVFEKWIPHVQHYLPKVPIIIVGLRSDLDHDKDKYMQKIYSVNNVHTYPYLTCSAKTGEGITELFEEAARVAVKHQKLHTKTERFADFFIKYEDSGILKWKSDEEVLKALNSWTGIVSIKTDPYPDSLKSSYVRRIKRSLKQFRTSSFI